MAVETAMVTKTISGQDEDKLFRPPWWGRGDDVRQQRRDETKRRGRGVRLRDDFMQRAAGEPAIGKASIQRRQPERENLVNIRRARQQATQFLHDSGAVARHGSDGGLSPQHVQN
jgi:hypothetical protein